MAYVVLSTTGKNQKKRMRALEMVAAQMPHAVNDPSNPDSQMMLPSATTSPVCSVTRCPDVRPPSASGSVLPDPTSSELPVWAVDPALEQFPEPPPAASPASSSLCQSSLTPLHLAISTGNEHMARLLLRHGADVLRRDGNGSTALHLAAEAGNEGLVELLLQSMDPNEVDYTRRTPLFRAVEAGNDAVVRLLLDAAADVNLKDIWGNSVLHLAVKAGSETLTLLLLGHDADIDAGS